MSRFHRFRSNRFVGDTERSAGFYVHKLIKCRFDSEVPVQLKISGKTDCLTDHYIHLDIYVLGGKTDSNELNMSGNLGLRSLQGIYADKAFIGAGGVTLEYGVSDYAIQDESLREEIIKRAGTVILVAHSEKFGNNAFSLGIPLKNIVIVVTDKGLSSEYRRGLTELGINVFLADGEDVYVDD